MIAGFVFLQMPIISLMREVLIRGKSLTDDEFPGCFSTSAGLSEYGVKTLFKTHFYFFRTFNESSQYSGRHLI